MPEVAPQPIRTLHVNGSEMAVNVEPSRMLLSVLRDDLDLTGTKYACGEGQCGACTVLADGAIVRSCRTPVQAVANKQITTIEGLEQDGRLHPVQQAFLDQNAFQCGYCTAGMIMMATGFLRKTPQPTDAQIRQAMNGNICRCGTYPRIVEAVKMAAKAKGESRNG